MEITPEQYEKIKDSLPLQRGNVRLTNLQVLNAVLFVAEQGCKWRGLPKRFGNWHTVYVRMNRWARNGVLDRVFEMLQLEQIVRIRIEAFALDYARTAITFALSPGNDHDAPQGRALLEQLGPDAITRHEYQLSCARRTTHVAVLGKTGSGKSSLLRRMAQEDIAAGRGFIWFDLHGDTTPFLLRTIAERERKLERHLSDRVVLIAPADREFSAGS